MSNYGKPRGNALSSNRVDDTHTVQSSLRKQYHGRPKQSEEHLSVRSEWVALMVMLF
jgi:hypothetical protein